MEKDVYLRHIDNEKTHLSAITFPVLDQNSHPKTSEDHLRDGRRDTSVVPYNATLGFRV